MLLVLACLAFAGAPIRPPEVSGAKLVTYAAKGSTIDGIVASLDRNTPYRDPSGQRWHGGTTYQLKWSWKPTSGGRCAVSPLRAKVVVTLPVVRPSDAHREAVHDYVVALTAHEQGHVDRARDEIQALRATLKAIAPAPCQALGDRVNAAGQATLRRLEQSMVTYDERTGHGATQDARLQ